jgi:hypothetical protein
LEICALFVRIYKGIFLNVIISIGIKPIATYYYTILTQTPHIMTTTNIKAVSIVFLAMIALSVFMIFAALSL